MRDIAQNLRQIAEVRGVTRNALTVEAATWDEERFGDPPSRRTGYAWMNGEQEPSHQFVRWFAQRFEMTVEEVYLYHEYRGGRRLFANMREAFRDPRQIKKENPIIGYLRPDLQHRFAELFERWANTLPEGVRPRQISDEERAQRGREEVQIQHMWGFLLTILFGPAYWSGRLPPLIEGLLEDRDTPQYRAVALYFELQMTAMEAIEGLGEGSEPMFIDDSEADFDWRTWTVETFDQETAHQAAESGRTGRLMWEVFQRAVERREREEQLTRAQQEYEQRVAEVGAERAGVEKEVKEVSRRVRRQLEDETIPADLDQFRAKWVNDARELLAQNGVNPDVLALEPLLEMLPAEALKGHAESWLLTIDAAITAANGRVLMDQLVQSQAQLESASPEVEEAAGRVREILEDEAG